MIGYNSPLQVGQKLTFRDEARGEARVLDFIVSSTGQIEWIIRAGRDVYYLPLNKVYEQFKFDYGPLDLH